MSLSPWPFLPHHTLGQQSGPRDTGWGYEHHTSRGTPTSWAPPCRSRIPGLQHDPLPSQPVPVRTQCPGLRCRILSHHWPKLRTHHIPEGFKLLAGPPLQSSAADG